jgi:hypothetical protein
MKMKIVLLSYCLIISVNALQDLWDFNQDDSELSQDSDTDEQESMDNT